MGSTWKNILLSFSVTIFCFLFITIDIFMLSTAKSISTEYFYINPFYSILFIFLSIAGFCLYAYLIYSAVYDANNIKEKFSQQQIHPVLFIILSIPFLFITLPVYLNYRDKLLKQNGQFKSFFSQKFYITTLCFCNILTIFFIVFFVLSFLQIIEPTIIKDRGLMIID
jgi:hypothetical protein